MNESPRLPAVLVYVLPVIGWLIVFVAYRSNKLAMFHLKQAIGLVLFLIGTLLAWVVMAWLLAWIPLMATLSVSLFTLVMALYFYSIFIWLQGINRALNNQYEPLPLFGEWANRLPLG